MTELLHISGQFPYLGLFMALILGSIGLPFPEDAILLWCGFLISKNTVEPLPALLVVYSGVIISDLLLFSIGRRYGRLLVRHRRFQRILSPEKLVALELKFSTHGALLIFIGRHIFWLRAKIFLAAGVMKMPPRKFLIADAISALLFVAAMVAAGNAGTECLPSLKGLAIQPWYVVPSALVILTGIFVLLRHLNPKRQNSCTHIPLCHKELSQMNPLDGL
ncbi:MAG TPA: DedA family protein [Thermodesulfovibrionales bacterium]|nr:DedA family protein [Thermodesulfovibrionales bacterium]